ncbi:Hpt domain-containing protein [Roseibacterium sp. SDUM158016]|uniref:Hpt domain-containing protein n=1 Tax=Roseicyclus sediminis TaxID=2980997 RepID=UPI0021CDEDE4|nr:Hpt domain-containing protein [Roseibacterium sp. SDUM158016]MCU4654303.1 Hpt domain-containing protein [Roseibacterium sp. SDUM158016]
MITTSANSQVNAGIAKLRDGFLDRVAERVITIDAILAAASGPTIPEADVRTIVHHTHKTAGVAATFGFAELGARASEVERILTSGGAEIPWQAVRPAIETLLDEMESALDS